DQFPRLRPVRRADGLRVVQRRRAPIRVYQLDRHLCEAAAAVAVDGGRAGRQRVVGLRAEEARVRTMAAAAPAGGRLPGDHRPPLAHLLEGVGPERDLQPELHLRGAARTGQTGVYT